jgi:four helix bundle protein
MANADGLRARAKEFAVRILRFVRKLPRDPSHDAVAWQLAKSGPSVSANYHSAGRSRSRAEFIARLGVVVDEADESVHWLGVLKETGLAEGAELESLLDEGKQLRAIFLASLATARRNHGGRKRS